MAEAGAHRTLRGWGGGIGAYAVVAAPEDGERAQAAIARLRDSGAGDRDGAIARGLGRSYGDAAQLSGGLVLEMTRCKGFALDDAQGTVTAQGGVTIGELLRALVPAGWSLPVVPGTQHVTIAGAIASDVHGKNHATAGTFGAHVHALGLLTAADEVLELAPGRGDGLFEATLGGMGLTGVILWARFALAPVSGCRLEVDTDRVESVDGALAALSAPGGAYRVAWLDLLGSRPGRGVVTRAAHAAGGDSAGAGRSGDGERLSGDGGSGAAGGATVRARVTVPARWPAGVLRASTVRAFNELRLRQAPRRERGRPEGFGAHMFPLDALGSWPRLYGRQGLIQYQFVVPHGREHVLHAVIEGLRRARVPCFLAVLKDLGAANDAPLSFPLAGWTLALDLPRAAPGIVAMLDGFDELVAQAGGRVYLTKDARLRPEATAAMYPRLGQWRAARERADPNRLWRSDLARRTDLIGAR
ncbi:MAG: FAD-binding protein [Solirubrobacteraceae bacterium]